MRLGLIGRGRWGQVYLRTLARIERLPDWVVGKDDVRFDADAIIIATPAETHFDLAAAAMRRGVHVLIEKPVTMSSSEARLLLHLADVKGVSCFVGHTHLYALSWHWFKARAIGPTLRIRMGAPFRAPKWWCKGSHAVAMAIDLHGPVKVTCFENDRLTLIHADATSHIEIWEEEVGVHCESGGVIYDPTLKEPSPMSLLLYDFFRACEKGGDIRGLRLGFQVTEVIEACYK